MKFRPAAKRDLDRLAEISLIAYPDDRPVLQRHADFLANPFASLGDFVVGDEDGVIVAQARLFAFRTAFGGRSLKMGGVASVAVAPGGSRPAR